MPNNVKLLENITGSPSTFGQFFDFVSDVELESGNYFTLAQKTGGSCVVSDDVKGGAMVITTDTTDGHGYNIIGTSLPIILDLGDSVAFEAKVLRTEAAANDIRKSVAWLGLGPADTDINGGAPNNAIYFKQVVSDGSATGVADWMIEVRAASASQLATTVASLTKDTWYKLKYQIDMDPVTATKGTLTVYVDDVQVLHQTGLTFPAATVFLGLNGEFLAAGTAGQNQVLKVDWIGWEATH